MDIKNKSDLNLILNLTERLEINIQREKNTLTLKSSGKQLAEILEKLTEKDGIKSIKDAMKWQREIRADRKLLSH